MGKHPEGAYMRISVTAKDIQRGIPGRTASCPVAWAMARRFPEVTPVWVNSLRATRRIKGHLHSIELPPRIREWIKKFDNELTVKPTNFTIPDEWNRWRYG